MKIKLLHTINFFLHNTWYNITKTFQNFVLHTLYKRSRFQGYHVYQLTIFVSIYQSDMFSFSTNRLYSFEVLLNTCVLSVKFGLCQRNIKVNGRLKITTDLYKIKFSLYSLSNKECITKLIVSFKFLLRELSKNIDKKEYIIALFSFIMSYKLV